MTFEVFEPKPLSASDIRAFDLYGAEIPDENYDMDHSKNTNKKQRKLIYSFLTKILSSHPFGSVIIRKKHIFPLWLRIWASNIVRPVTVASFNPRGNNFNLYSHDPIVGFGLPFSKSPKVSIIVPFYNNIDVTLACLKKLQRNQDQTQYEIILVDDASNDFRLEEIYKLRGVKVIKQKENQGYLKSTNLGATFANGRYIALLNNDTEPLSGWLDELVLALESEEKLGIAGSRLIDVENRVSEAGSLIFKNQDIWNLGRGFNNNDPIINFSRYVDYCSAAAILIDAQLWREIGGFDQIYAPAYFEDTDLAMEVWSRGWKVKYIYSSVVKHIEGASHGTDVRVGMKRNQLKNRDIFFKKWPPTEYFTWPYQNGPRYEYVKQSQGIILVFDQLLPRGDQDAGSFRMERLIAALQDMDLHVVFVTMNPWHSISKLDSLRQKGVEVHLDASSAFRELSFRKQRINAVILSRLETFENCIQSVKSFIGDTPIIFDTVDIQTLRIENKIGLGPRTLNSKSKLMHRELSAIKASDSTWVVSNFEKKILTESTQTLNVDVVSWDVPIKENLWHFQNHNNILFVGSFGHPPNIEGLSWFVNNVWPIILKENQRIQLTVCGSGMKYEDQMILNSSGITFAGWVPDLQQYYLNSGCVIAPLLSGAGLKGKILEAMSFGVPVITTSIGAEGIASQEDGILVISDSAQEFAAAILKVLNESAMAESMAERGIKLLEDHFSYDCLKEQISKTLIRLGVIN